MIDSRPASVDGKVEAIVRGSAVNRSADGMLSAVERAWLTSWIRNRTTSAPSNRIRFWSLATVAASVTTLLLAPLGTTPRPLAWVVPAVAGGIALAVLVSTPAPKR